MKISVITVCKNAENTIEKTLQSVFNQTYHDIEYIIIDGLSTDITLDIVEKYKDKIDYLLSEEDTGIYNAMNKGIKLATGDILYFLNADDRVYDENVFQEVINVFRKRKNNPDIIFGNMLCSNNRQLSDEQVNMKPGDIYKYDFFNSGFSFMSQSVCQQVMFYKKSLFDKFGLYDESYNIYGDWEINARFMLKHNCSCKYIDRTIADFELGGISTKKTSETDKIREAEFNKIKELYLKKEAVIHKIIYKNLYSFMSKYFRSLLRLYDNNENFKKQLDQIIAGLFAQKINLC